MGNIVRKQDGEWEDVQLDFENLSPALQQKITDLEDAWHSISQWVNIPINNLFEAMDDSNAILNFKAISNGQFLMFSMSLKYGSATSDNVRWGVAKIEPKYRPVIDCSIGGESLGGQIRASDGRVVAVSRQPLSANTSYELSGMYLLADRAY